MLPAERQLMLLNSYDSGRWYAADEYIYIKWIIGILLICIYFGTWWLWIFSLFYCHCGKWGRNPMVIYVRLSMSCQAYKQNTPTSRRSLGITITYFVIKIHCHNYSACLSMCCDIHVWVFRHIVVCSNLQQPLLLTLFNINPTMDK